MRKRSLVVGRSLAGHSRYVRSAATQSSPRVRYRYARARVLPGEVGGDPKLRAALSACIAPTAMHAPSVSFSTQSAGGG